MVDKLTTGIEKLDRELSGGLPRGTLVVLYAPPISQSELILQEIAATRNTLYITVERGEQYVRSIFEEVELSDNSVIIRQPDFEDTVASTRDALRQITGEANIIIDSMSVIEESADKVEYIQFLQELKTKLEDTGSIGVLHCLKTPNEPVNRDTTLQVADAVLDLDVDDSGDKVKNKLSVVKFRGGAALKDTIKLELIDGVAVDTSRDIA